MKSWGLGVFSLILFLKVIVEKKLKDHSLHSLSQLPFLPNQGGGEGIPPSTILVYTLSMRSKITQKENW